MPVTNRFLREGFSSLCAEEQRFFAVFSLLGEVANGGFRGYFASSTSTLAPAAADALRVLGCHRAEALLREAMAVLPGGAPQEDWDARQSTLDTLGDDALDQWQRLSEVFRLEEDEIMRRLEEDLDSASNEGMAAGA